MPWKRFGLCVHKMNEDGSKGERVRCFDTTEEAEDQVKALYANVDENNSVMFAPLEFASVTMGEPFRLFKWGRVYKGGKARDIVPESEFKLPHFRPPIKLGSHADDAPAGGFIVGLEKRPDGLYAIPEWNEKGAQAMKDGAYRYQSPEVLWHGFYENPQTGAPIEGPLIIGDALLHTPHLGEEAALYSFEPHIQKETSTMTVADTVQVPASWVERLFGKGSDPESKPPKPVSAITPEQFDAVVRERDELAAKQKAAEEQAAKEKVEAEKRALIVKLTAELQSKTEDKETYGATYVELKAAEEAAGMLAGMSEEQREWCMRTFRAYAAVADYSKIITEKGKSGAGAATGDGASVRFAAALKVKLDEGKSPDEALKLVQTENPGLVEEYQAEVRGKAPKA